MPDQPPAPLDYENAGARSKRRKLPVVLSILLLLLGGIVILWVVQASMPRGGSHATNNRAKCQSNLRQIGVAISQYQREHQHNFPDTLDRLLEQGISSTVFVCPGSNDEAADGATTQETITNFHTPNHLSYIYIGKGLTDQTAGSNTVVLYEPLIDHDDQGMNVLFGDGHAEWFDPTIAAKIIAADKSGVNPVRLVKGGIASTAP